MEIFSKRAISLSIHPSAKPRKYFLGIFSQLAPLQPSCLSLPVLEQPPKNFAARTLRHHVNKLDPTPQPFIRGFALLNMLLNISYKTMIVNTLARDRSGLDYEGFRQLAGCFVRNWDYGCICNGGVSKEMGF